MGAMTEATKRSEAPAAATPETLAAQGMGWIEPVTGAVTPPIYPATTYARDEGYRRIGKAGYSRDDNPGYEQAEALIAALEDAPAAAECVRTLLELEARFDAQLRHTKRARGAYEFSDVLRMTLELLGEPAADGRLEPTAIARRLQQRYEHVLVDEYQDTSPVPG